ncbi:aminotransferase class V-fold PLP-dependent enzyme [Blastococcus sp. MG754426]|uniref:aminomethyl-transferring glycine dehydrogenase subunit GcvPB n=1 Tax=unclassified Blastococcus TaxID=2619396 RepID=UPI001EF0350E|nr:MULTISPECIES: aminomethyl-transferring glycine dehydrogenase subunit GcvPB [unclassified Blastococcus]MCF6508116.1 aminotransferase class V-fold PLP-dependent enzyme [Blastococcus sp. MG754426]MCF6511555.1 aminotransferase class V-fold PLP-dependent enzyme [Blastococcus sp. MG754427]
MSEQLRRYHAAVWDEPLVMEMGAPGRRGTRIPDTEPGIAQTVGPAEDLVPRGMRRAAPPALPELTEPEVQRHYLHLSQQTMGMMGISLFGTCTMKYNPQLGEQVVARPEVAEVHPHQHESTMQGLLQVVHDFDLVLRELSGMDRFVFQAGGGADAAYLHACLTRAYHASRGELGQRTEIITTAQAHPCNPATAAAAGFDVITLPLEGDGYPSVAALEAALSDRTAALMVNNPDDMGIYNPHIKRWVELVHEAGGLCFYDHANFNGVMTRIRAADLGFDACMFMLHKTFGVAKGGGGPAVGAYGCTAELERFLPGPLVTRDEEGYHLVEQGPEGVGRVREFLGNVPQVVRAYAWARAMGAAGMREAADISVLANNYMEQRLLRIPGVTKSQPHLTERRLEMTRYSLGELTERTGVTAHDVQNRMVDFGIDAFWLSHEPWIVPEPFTPEAGEMWSKEDLDYWMDVLAHVCDEAHRDPDLVRTAPHRQVIGQLDGSALDDPERWATTWRAHRRKRPAAG